MVLRSALLGMVRRHPRSRLDHDFASLHVAAGKVYDRNNQVQRETMQPVPFTKQENAALVKLIISMNCLTF